MEAERAELVLTINGERRELAVDTRATLLDVLREQLGLTGAKKGCDHGQCGACTVLVGGRRVNACLLLAVAVRDEVTTIEGLADGEKLHPLQQAFWNDHALQCGYCTPGMIMAAADLLTRNPDPTEEEIRHGLEGNLCRCTGYHNIVKAVRSAAGAQTGGTLETPAPPEGARDTAEAVAEGMKP
jgi:aerobic carbon-monoxide dehydrogenase small subunit